MMKRLFLLLCLAGIAFSFQKNLNASSFPKYLVIFDLDKDDWQYRYTDEHPDLTNDNCRTTELWLRYIPAGTFMMGSPEYEWGRIDWEVQHKVTLTKPFYIGVFECTQKQWEYVMGDRPSYFNNDDYYATRPVEQVSYDMIRGSNQGAGWPSSNAVDDDSFMGVLRAKTGLEFDLPTGAQWEYSCRAGTITALNSGKDLIAIDLYYHYENYETDTNMDEVGRYALNRNLGNDSQDSEASQGTAKVGSYLPNTWGLYDMHGNVYEWCLDWWDASAYSSSAVTDPVGLTESRYSYRLKRGGSFRSENTACRSANMENDKSSTYRDNVGFRIVCLSLPPTYAVTVVKGTADKTEAAEGETVAITANMPSSGQTFDKWTGRGVTFANETAPETTFEMPASAVTVTATYKALPSVKTYKIVVVNGKADKEKAAAGETVALTANNPPAGKVFDKWTGGAVFDDPTSPATTFTMPAKAVTPKALYKRK